MGREPSPLTPTQELLFERLSKGYPTSKMLARDLRMNPKRIDKHFENALHRLAARDRREALAIWLKNRETTPGNHPPGGAFPLPNLAPDDIVNAPFAKEGAQNAEVEAVEAIVERASDEKADTRQDRVVLDVARSGGPASQPLSGSAAGGSDQPLGGEDREPIALGAGRDDPRGHFARNGGDRWGPPALLSGLHRGDEHELTRRGQILFTVQLIGLIAGGSLVALFAVKEMLLQLQ